MSIQYVFIIAELQLWVVSSVFSMDIMYLLLSYFMYLHVYVAGGASLSIDSDCDWGWTAKD